MKNEKNVRKKECPECGIKLKRNEKVCVSCGHIFESDKESEFKNCPQCSTKVHSKTKQCFNCTYEF